MTILPAPPVAITPAVVDPDLVHALIDRGAPYWPVQRYVVNQAEYASLSGDRGDAPMIVAPVFRGNWALPGGDGSIEDDAAPLVHDPRFIDAARRLFDAEVVRPHTVYVNLTWQLPFAQGAGHTDVPAFRGFDRRDWPITFLTIMGGSELFEDVRVKIATGVAWFYAGTDGGFEYWPEGPDAPSVVHEGAIDNTMLVGDNDFMWHRVRPTGDPADGMVSLTLDAQLQPVDETTWCIVDGGRTVATFPRHRMRVSLSWKADVFRTADEARIYDEHLDDIDLTGVLDRFRRDLAAKGIELPQSDDPTRDPAVIDVLRDAYVRYPS